MQRGRPLTAARRRRLPAAPGRPAGGRPGELARRPRVADAGALDIGRALSAAERDCASPERARRPPAPSETARSSGAHAMNAARHAPRASGPCCAAGTGRTIPYLRPQGRAAASACGCSGARWSCRLQRDMRRRARCTACSSSAPSGAKRLPKWRHASTGLCGLLGRAGRRRVRGEHRQRAMSSVSPKGFATGASVHEASGHAVAVAPSTPAARQPRWRVARATGSGIAAGAPIVVCADDDRRHAGQPRAGARRGTGGAGGGRGSWPGPTSGADRPAERMRTSTTCTGMRVGCPPWPDSGCAPQAPPSAASTGAGGTAAIGRYRARALARPRAADRARWTPLPYPGRRAAAAAARRGDARRRPSCRRPTALVAVLGDWRRCLLAAQGLVNVRRDDQLAGPVSLHLRRGGRVRRAQDPPADMILGAALREWERGPRAAIAPDLAAQTAHALGRRSVRGETQAGLLEAIQPQAAPLRRTPPKEESRGWTHWRATAPAGCIAVPRLLYADATRRGALSARSRQRLAERRRAVRPRRARCSGRTAWATRRSCATWRCSTCCGTAARSRWTAAASRRSRLRDRRPDLRR
ncbi:MAG: hypothetical protein MZW92_18650 [Comamonadaceae bacterium]|nr:hypothetical protein [Comamonadaceae bacterium]